jgi:hypothetical protein
MTDEEFARERSKRRHPAYLVPKQQELREKGLCASHDGNGNLCTRRANHPKEVMHAEQVIGGVDDGLTTAEWPW